MTLPRRFAMLVLACGASIASTPLLAQEVDNPVARCLAAWGAHPFGKNPAYRTMAASVKVFGIGENPADTERTELSGGRVWIARQEGENLHARMFVPYPGGVVMGVAILGAEGAGALPEVRAAFETLAIDGH